MLAHFAGLLANLTSGFSSLFGLVTDFRCHASSSILVFTNHRNSFDSSYV
jgi:hypothetical protein